MFHPTSALNSCEIAGTSHYQSICIIIVDIKEPHEEALEQLMNETQQSTSAPVANLEAPAGKRKAEDELHNEPTDYSDENSDDHSDENSDDHSDDYSDEEAELQSFPEYSGARSKSMRRSHRRREKICAKGRLVVEFLLRSIDDREPCLFEFAKPECPALRPLMVKAWGPNIEDVHELELTLLGNSVPELRVEGRVLPASREINGHIVFYGTHKKTKTQLSREKVDLMEEDSWSYR
jgi:hypothetical protein